MSIYVEIRNHVIVAMYDGVRPDDPAFQSLPRDAMVSIGDDRRSWDEAWNLRPRSVRVAEGLLPVPPGHLLVDGVFVEKTLAQKLADGEVERPFGLVVNEAGTDWRGANLEEQYLLGDISLPQLKARLKQEVEFAIPLKRKAGFVFGGVRYQADQGVTEAVNGVLTAIAAGVPVQFPLPWRSGDNQRPAWPSKDVFASFAAELLAFVNQLYQQAWDTKDAIAAATTAQEAGEAFDRGNWSTITQ